MTTTAANRFKCDNCGHSQSFNDGFQCSTCGQGTIVPVLTDAQPDAAAVEAVSRIDRNNMVFRACGSGLWDCDREKLAHIITDAYEHRMTVAKGDAQTVDRQHLEMSNALARLTAEREVRKKLVAALEQTVCHASDKTPCFNSCPRCDALAEAAKLDDSRKQFLKKPLDKLR